MKQLCIVLILLVVIGLKAQSTVSFVWLQDTHLAFFNDGKGNIPFTADMTFKIKLKGQGRPLGHTVIAIKYRYTDLAFFITNDATGALQRYGAEVQYAFHMNTDKWYFAPLVGFGRLSRTNLEGATSWEFGGEITFDLYNWLSLVSEGIFMERPDLPNKDLGFNGSIGIQANF